MSNSPCHSFFKFFRKETEKQEEEDSFDYWNRLRDTSYDDDNFLKSFYNKRKHSNDWNKLLKPQSRSMIDIKQRESKEEVINSYKSIAIYKQSKCHLQWRKQSKYPQNSYGSIYCKKENLPYIQHHNAYMNKVSSNKLLAMNSNSNSNSNRKKKHNDNQLGEVEQYDFSLYHIERRLNNYKHREDAWNEQVINSKDYDDVHNHIMKEKKKKRQMNHNEQLNREQEIEEILKKKNNENRNKIDIEAMKNANDDNNNDNNDNNNKGIKSINRFIPRHIKSTSHSLLSKTVWK